MYLNANAVIDERKLTQYLLVLLPKDDKSQFLATAGYTLANWRQLEQDIRKQILPLEAIPSQNTPYGQKYEIIGTLTGRNGVILSVKTIWIVTSESTRVCYTIPKLGEKK